MTYKELTALCQQCLITHNMNITTSAVVLSIGNSTFGTLGNFTVSIGKPKSRKTFNVSAIAASAISNTTVLNYQASFGKRNKVIYIDTEQSQYHCSLVLHRIIAMAGIPTNQVGDRLCYYSLRSLNIAQRIELIEHLLQNTDARIGLLIIDGIRDLVSDINNPGESNNIVNKLMQWSAMYNIHIHVVLHVNKADDNARGHLGTELINKAESVINIQTNNDGMTKVSPRYMRDITFDDFIFNIDEDSIPTLTREINNSDNHKRGVEHISDDTKKLIIMRIFENSNKDLGFEKLCSQLIQEYENIGYSRGRTTISKEITAMLNEGIIKREGHRYSINEQYV